MGSIVVIGGGAAGMMAAMTAAGQQKAKVILLEKNEKLGKKLFITGKGRCNVTNACEPDELRANVCSNPKFLYSAFAEYDNRAVMETLERLGCPLKTERGGRVFPTSDHASDVTAALTGECKRLGVEIRLRAEVAELLTADGGVTGVRLTNGEKIAADRVIVCTGGLSYPSTGSTGDGLRFGEQTGHRIVPCSPSLVPLETAEDWCAELMGLSLRNVTLTMRSGKKLLYREQGEMLFTHFGVSGPLVLTASCYLSKAKEPVTLTLDLKPALDAEQLDRRILRDFETQQNKAFKNALGGLLPAKLIPVIVRLSGVDPDKPVHALTREERRALGQLLKALELHVTGTRSYAEAIITRGGVSVRDVDPSTMESKIVRNLYFAGEVLDLDARTGGYNLQIAWSTGHLAGSRAAAEEEEA